MKAFVLSIIAFGIFALAACGQGSANILKERAKGIANQGNTRGDEPPATTPAPSAAAPAPTPTPAPPPNPALTATLQNIANLQFDLARLQTNGAAKAQLTANLNAAAVDKKPSPGSVSKLAGDLTTALAGKKLSSDQQKKLAQYCHAIANGSHLSPAQEQTVMDGAQKILETAQIPAGDVTKIVADMKGIIRESR